MFGNFLAQSADLEKRPEKRQSYEVLFERAGLQGHAAYKHLGEFLVILQRQGVRWVWFDAVCINQTDKKEKEHEIQHMGTYYQKAIGCYVLQHGIGRGFELLRDSDNGVKEGLAAQTPQLPRWFTRAWTLQEWILPPKVTFILDLASKPHFCMVAFFVLVHAKMSCMCCGYSCTISPLLVHKCLRLSQQANGHDKEENSLCSAMTRMAQKEVCCFKAPHDPHFRKVPERRQWYFSDDLGYSFLLRLKFVLDQVSDNIFVEDLKDIRVGDADLELSRQIKVKQAILQSNYGKEVTSYSRVVREISIRDASNPEDRVLSVLMLLGAENAVQVRTGKSLQAQLCQFAKSLVDSENSIRSQELLIHLCMVDAFGSETPGMSWMPQFEVQKGSWQEAARAVAAPSMFGMETNFSLQELEIAMRCVAVSDTGMLHVEADVCTGKLVLVPSHPLQKRQSLRGRADELSRPVVLEVKGQVIYLSVSMYPELAQPTTCILTNDLEAVLQSGSIGKVCIAFQSPGLQYLRDRITVFLVKIAAVRSYADGRVLGLVCVQEGQGSPFHKIGYLILTGNHFPSSQKMLCCIGGLGHGLNKLLFNPVGF